MKGKSNIKLLILFGILMALIIIFIFSNINNKSIENVSNDLETITYEETEYLYNTNTGEAPKSYFLIREDEGKLYAGDMVLEKTTSNKPGEVIANYSGTLTETNEFSSPGILSVDLEVKSEREKEDLENEMPYSLEFKGIKYSGKLQFTGDFESKMYKGTLLKD